MPAGRPRETSRPPEEMIALGEEMIQWVKEHPEILHLSEWYTIHKGFIYNEWKVYIKCKEFYPYYEQALKLVGRKYLDKDSKVRDGISHRWQRVYFKDLKEEEDADHQEKLDRELDHKVKLLKEEMKAKAEHGLVGEDVQEAYDKLIDQLSSLQSDRKSAKSNISKEAKS